MSYGSDYKERQQRRRRQDARALLYILRSVVTTAAIVAIAFAFDVPRKLRAKLWGEPPAVAERPEHPQPAQPSEPPRREHPPADDPAPETAADPPRRAFDLPGQREKPSPRVDEIVVPKREARPDPPGLDVPRIGEQPAPASEAEVLVLALERRLMRTVIAEGPAVQKQPPQVRVLGLGETEVAIELNPAHGEVRDELEIFFPKHPRARLLVRTDRVGNRLFLIIEPQMKLRTDVPVPLLLKRIKHEAHQTRRDAEEFHATLAGDKVRLPELEAWLKNGRAIPLDQFKQGKIEVELLQASIKERDKQASAVTAYVAEIDALEELAGELHDKAELRFEVVDRD